MRVPITMVASASPRVPHRSASALNSGLTEADLFYKQEELPPAPVRPVEPEKITLRERNGPARAGKIGVLAGCALGGLAALVSGDAVNRVFGATAGLLGTVPAGFIGAILVGGVAGFFGDMGGLHVEVASVGGFVLGAVGSVASGWHLGGDIGTAPLILGAATVVAAGVAGGLIGRWGVGTFLTMEMDEKEEALSDYAADMYKYRKAEKAYNTKVAILEAESARDKKKLSEGKSIDIDFNDESIQVGDFHLARET